MKLHISTSVQINAQPEKVWAAFINFKEYPNWNPFIKSITGPIAVGEKFNAEISNMKFKPTLLVMNPSKEFTWIGHLLFPGIFDGQHSFQFIDNKDGTTTLIQSENFNGILVSLFRKKLNTETKDGFNLMNEKLKQLVESQEMN